MDVNVQKVDQLQRRARQLRAILHVCSIEDFFNWNATTKLDYLTLACDVSDEVCTIVRNFES